MHYRFCSVNVWLQSIVLSFIVLNYDSGVSNAQGLIFDEADIALFNLEPAAEISTSTSGTNDLWARRATLGSNGTIFESAVGAENSNELTHTVFGVAPGTYDVYGVYWTDDDENWGINLGVATGVYTEYSFSGGGGLHPSPGTTKGITAATAYWSVFPPNAPAQTTAPVQPARPFTQRDPGNPLVMLLGHAGQAVVDGSGQLQLFVNDTPYARPGGYRRTWFDGLAYAPVGTPISMEVEIDRLSGELTLSNPTPATFQIKSIQLESPSGTLIGSEWDPITGRLDGMGSGDFDFDSWSIVSPLDPSLESYSTLLLESENLGDGLGGALDLGDSLNLGPVVHRSPFEDILVHLTFADDSFAVISPKYTGGVQTLLGDFDGDESIDFDDYQTLLSNLGASVGGITRLEGYELGNMTNDGRIDGRDFIAFRIAYDQANGEGAFDQMLAAQVPEPSTLALLSLVGGVLVLRFRNRVIAIAAVLLLCISASVPTQAVTLLAVDVNQGQANPAADTQAGYESFMLGVDGTGTTSAPTARMIGSYTVTIGPFDDGLDENNLTAGDQLTAGTLTARERTTPVNYEALTIANLYKDFLFASSSVGPTGGIDLSVTGGALMPNTPYVVSIYSWDRDTIGYRSADWYDLTDGTSPILSAPFLGSAVNEPTTNDAYRFSGVAHTDANGLLALRGRSTAGYTATGAAALAVFLNGFEIEEFSGLTLEVNSTSGATRILNEQNAPVDLSYYEIRSVSGQLIESNWTSIDSTENDDPLGTGWDELTTGDEFFLSESNLFAHTSVAASGDLGDSINLGSIFTGGGTQDLRFYYAGPNDTVQLLPGLVKYVTGAPELIGDYNDDGVVDAADYVVWRDNLNSTTDLPGDLIGGMIDEDQYDQWRENFGATPGLGNGAAAIPEPSSLWLLIVAASSLFIGCRRFPSQFDSI